MQKVVQTTQHSGSGTDRVAILYQRLNLITFPVSQYYFFYEMDYPEAQVASISKPVLLHHLGFCNNQSLREKIELQNE